MASDPGLFNLQIDGAPAGTGANVGNGGTTGVVSVPSTDTGQAHTIGETAGTSTTLADYFATYSCTDGAMTTTGDATLPFTVTVFNNANIVCTITNTRTAAGGPRAQSLLGSGSDTTQFMMHSLDGLYMFSPGCQQIQLPTGSTKFFDFSCLTPDPTGTVTTENYQHDQVHEAYFLGSGNGLHQICNQGHTGNAHVDYARSSRALAASDCTGLDFVAYARDGISWEAFDNGPGAGVDAMNNQTGTCAGSGGLTQFCLTQSQLQGIFLQPCSITNWSQVGGQNIPISIYTPQSGSGTRLTFDSFLGGSSAQCIPAAQISTHVIPENANSAIPAADQAGAIFPFSAGIWKTQVNGKNHAILGAIDDVAPTNSSISSGVFPFGRFLFNVFCNTCSSKNANAQQQQAAVNYVGPEGWICKNSTASSGHPGSHAIDPITGNNYRADIATAIGNSGFVPILSGAIGPGDPGNSDFCRLTQT